MGADDWIAVDLNGHVAAETTHCQDAYSIAFDQVAAFVLEPGSASGTIRFPSERLVDSLVEGVRRNSGLVVVDEVTTGMGRTGQWYGFNHYRLQPDIVVCGKGLGNGYPVSAVAMRGNVAKKLEEDGFHYVQSHQNDPLGCAVAKEVINVIRDEELIQRSSSLGALLLNRLRAMKDHYEAIRDVRGRGLMIGIELSDRVTRSVNSTHVHQKMLEKGLLVGHNPRRNIIRFLPPLTIEESEIAHLMTHLQQVFEEMA
jgi:acetylornithine aminotransferase